MLISKWEPQCSDSCGGEQTVCAVRLGESELPSGSDVVLIQCA